MNLKGNTGTETMERPYERCLQCGPAALSDAELLAVIIRCGTNGKNAVDLARDILAMTGERNGLAGIGGLSTEELLRLPGIGKVKAVQLQCVGELAKRIAVGRAARKLSFTSPSSIADYYMEQLRHEEQEVLLLMMLDSRMQLICDRILTRGTVNSSLISPRELFMTALRMGAVSVILVHNHPSGDPTPSEMDIRVTQKVAKGGELLDITLRDHIIIGDGIYYSFREESDDWDV